MTLAALLRQPKFIVTLLLTSFLSMLGLQFNVLGGFLIAYNLREVYAASGLATLAVGGVWTVVHLALVPVLGKGSVLAQVISHQAVIGAVVGLAAGWYSMPRVKSYFAWVAVAGFAMAACEGLTQVWGHGVYGFSYFGAMFDEIQRVSNQFLAASKAPADSIKASSDLLQPMMKYLFTVQLCLSMAIFYFFSAAWLRLFHSDRAPESSRLRHLELPKWLMVVMLAAWAVLLLTRNRDAWAPAFEGSVHALILCLFLYVAQGLAVLAHFFTRPGRQPWVGLILIALLAAAGLKVPQIYGVMFVLILGFGLFDPWLKYRRVEPPQT